MEPQMDEVLNTTRSDERTGSGSGSVAKPNIVIPTNRAIIPEDINGAFATVLRALQGHRTLESDGLFSSLQGVGEYVTALRDSDADAIREGLARMATLTEMAAQRYLLLSEQQGEGFGAIEARTALMRIALSALNTHARLMATLATLPVKEVGSEGDGEQ
jgi:hypothetical protein